MQCLQNRSWKEHEKRTLSWAIRNGNQNLPPNLPIRGAATSTIIRMAENKISTHRIIEISSTLPKLQFQNLGGIATPPTPVELVTRHEVTAAETSTPRITLVTGKSQCSMKTTSLHFHLQILYQCI